jgi:hypothetical protein
MFTDTNTNVDTGHPTHFIECRMKDAMLDIILLVR